MMRHECPRITLGKLRQERSEKSNRRGRQHHGFLRCALESHDTDFLATVSNHPEQAPTGIRCKRRHFLGRLNQFRSQTEYARHDKNSSSPPYSPNEPTAT